MKISDYAVKNYQFTLVVFLMIIMLGVSTLFNMPRSEDPDMNPPQFPIVVVLPGASPQDMEELVVDPIEEKISELEDMHSIRTSIREGVAVIAVEYNYESDVDSKYQELVREITALRNTLPQEIARLDIQKINPTAVNILQIALISENANRELLKFEAEKLQDALQKVPELKAVMIHGMPERIVRVDLQLEKMARMHLTVPQVISAIQSELANIPGGSIEAGEKSFNIKTSGNYQSWEEISNTLVFTSNGRNIALKDIANVHPDFDAETHITRLNGHRCVFVASAQKEGFNISETKLKYEPVLAAFKAELPENIDMVKHFDQADNVNHRLKGLGIDFLIAILLVSITLLPLGNRAALIVMISIPLSLGIGLVALNMLGYNLNQLSIVGLVVALGLLVDDSIVVVENIERWLRDGYSRMDATLLATKQIGNAVVGCTATLIIAFLPLVFMPEASGEFIRSLPMAVILCVIASMLVSLTIIPFLASRLLKEHKGAQQGNMFLRALQKGIHLTYAPFLNRALNRPWTTLLITALIFAGSVAMFKVIGFGLFPTSEKPQFLIDISTPLQTNISKTNEITKKVEDVLAKQKEIEYYAANVGKGNPRIYYNIIPMNERTDFAEIFVQLNKDVDPDQKTETIEKLRKEFNKWPDAKIEVKNFEQGPPILAPIEVKLLGKNLDTLRNLTFMVEEILEKTPGTLYIKNPVSHLQSDIKVNIDKEKAAAFGISTVEIDRTVRLAIAGIPMGTFTDKAGEEFKILVTTPKEERATLSGFDQLFVNNRQGVAIPLNQVAQLTMVNSPISINHLEKNRTVSVSAFVKKGFLNDAVINQVIIELDKLKLPKGYSYTMGGDVEARNKSFGGFGIVILVTIFLFIAVLILEFKTFKSTLIVLSVIPLGIIGAVIALWLTGNSLSFVAIVGLIALAGIEIKNSVLLVDFTNQLRAEGKDLETAIREAGEIRFLPIILTSMTAIGGLMPIALSTNPLIAPLAIVLIGGLISSTLLSRVVTPVIYKLIPPKVVLKDS